MNLPRRTFLKQAFSGTALAVAAGAGLLRPTRALATTWPTWPQAAFHQKHLPVLLRELFGHRPIVTGGVHLHAPLEAENGAVVPMVLESQVPHAQMLVLVVDKNPFPLVTKVQLTPDAVGFFNVRIKMGKSSLVRAYVATPEKVHTVTRQVKVTIGGCGG